MNAIDLISRAVRGLTNAKIRTALTALAIGVGAFTLTATLAANKGATNYTNKLIESNFDPAEIIVSKDDRLFGGGGFGSGPQEYEPGALNQFGVSFKQLTTEDVDKIEQTMGVESVRREFQLNPEYVTRPGEKRYTAEINVYSPSQLPELAAGELTDKNLNKNEIIISDVYLNILGYKNAEAAIGQTITINLRRATPVTSDQVQQAFLEGGVGAVENLQPFSERTETLTIKAVSKKAATALQADVALKVTAEKAEEMANFLYEGTDRFQRYILVYAKVANGEEKPNRDAVQSRLSDAGYAITTVEDTQSTLLQFVNVLTGIVLGFGALVLVASVFGIVNTQYISVLERTREIGLMKALGMKRVAVAWLFILEAAWVGFIGGSFGAGVAVLTGTLLNPLVSSQLGLGKDTYLLVFEPLSVAGVILVLTMIAMLSGLLPALRASQLDPIEALRSE